MARRGSPSRISAAARARRESRCSAPPEPAGEGPGDFPQETRSERRTGRIPAAAGWRKKPRPSRAMGGL